MPTPLFELVKLELEPELLELRSRLVEKGITEREYLGQLYDEIANLLERRHGHLTLVQIEQDLPLAVFETAMFWGIVQPPSLCGDPMQYNDPNQSPVNKMPAEPWGDIKVPCGYPFWFASHFILGRMDRRRAQLLRKQRLGLHPETKTTEKRGRPPASDRHRIVAEEIAKIEGDWREPVHLLRIGEALDEQGIETPKHWLKLDTEPKTWAEAVLFEPPLVIAGFKYSLKVAKKQKTNY